MCDVKYTRALPLRLRLLIPIHSLSNLATMLQPRYFPLAWFTELISKCLESKLQMCGIDFQVKGWTIYATTICRIILFEKWTRQCTTRYRTLRTRSTWPAITFFFSVAYSVAQTYANRYCWILSWDRYLTANSFHIPLAERVVMANSECWLDSRQLAFKLQTDG